MFRTGAEGVCPVDLTSFNILIFTGGAKEWDSRQIHSDQNAIYLVTKDGLSPVWEAPAQNLGEPHVLADFLTFCYSNYKADAYDLIF